MFKTVLNNIWSLQMDVAIRDPCPAVDCNRLMMIFVVFSFFILLFTKVRIFQIINNPLSYRV